MVPPNSLMRTIAGFVACILGSAMAFAADIRTDSSAGPAAGAVLEGQIGRGDFDKFKKFILNTGNVVELYLASPGGDLFEAMRIGLLVRLFKLSTIVPGKALTNQAHDLAARPKNRLPVRECMLPYLCRRCVQEP
jgi:hypothetical protein